MPHRWLLILILFVYAGHGFTQTYSEKNFVHYTTMNGLSDNYITGITQDEMGYLWISTTNGLNRYDGKEIKCIYEVPGKEGIISDKLSGVKSDADNLLVYSSKGAQWINIKNNRFTKLLVSENTLASAFQNAVFDATITGSNSCLITTYTGVYAFDSAGKLTYRYDYYKPDSAGNITSATWYGYALLKLDRYHVLHFDEKHKMSIFDSRNKNFQPIENYKDTFPALYLLRQKELQMRGEYKNNEIIFLDKVAKSFIIYDKESGTTQTEQPPEWFKKNLWWSSRWLTVNDSTAIIYNGNPGIYTIHIHPGSFHFTYDSVPLFKEYDCSAALLSSDGRLWIGTDKGLFYQKKNATALHVVTLPFSKDTLTDFSLPFNCFLRQDSLLYVGSYNYSNIPSLVLDANTYRLKKKISFSTLSPLCNQLWNIIEYSKDTLWFATQDGLVWYNSRNENFGRVHIEGVDSLIRHHAISLLYKDSKGIIWLQAWWGSGVLMYDPSKGIVRRFSINDKNNYLPIRVVNFVTEDKNGDVWFAENGLTRWNRQKQQFDTLITSYYGFNKNNAKILSLSSDAKGDLIFCNENNGVLFYNPQTGIYRQVSTREGLQENAAYTALLVNDDLWVVTHNYITAIDQSDGKAISYSYTDSIPPVLFYGMYHDEVNRRVLFGYDKTILWTDDSINYNKITPPPFYIDAIEVIDDTTILFPPDKIELNYKQNDIAIHYSALNFDNAAANRFQYRVNGTDWVSMGNENLIHFSRLSPGKYQVEIKYYTASNASDETIRKMLMVISPPFWYTWWFIILLSAAMISAVFAVYKNRIRQIRQRANVDKQLAEYEMKALHAQINPHFVSNCLNSIREMILNDENRQASRYLSKFAHLMRITLDQSSQPFISLKDNIEYLQRYIEMEKIRKSNFSYRLTADENIDTEEISLPPMLIQPFIENAIWHGAPTRGGELQLRIHFFLKEGQLVCIVEDNGIGIDASLAKKKQLQTEHHSLGITNVQQRIRVLNEKYNWQSSVTIQDKANATCYSETGTVVTLYLPTKKEL